MDVLRTPDERFADLPDYPFVPHYVEVSAGDSGAIRIHYLDEGPADGQVVLMLHGSRPGPTCTGGWFPSWWKRACGRSQSTWLGSGAATSHHGKDYSFQAHVDWTWAAIHSIGLQGSHWSARTGVA